MKNECIYYDQRVISFLNLQIEILFLKNIYLFIHDRERERGRDRQREKQAPCQEPDVELDPGTTGSHPGPKADAKPLSHPGIPQIEILKQMILHFCKCFHD